MLLWTTLAAILGLAICQTTSAPSMDSLVQSLFNQGDTDKDGIYSKAEALAHSLKEDANGDGKVSLDEYVRSWTALHPGLSSVGAKVFARFDADSNGFIEKTDLDSAYALVDADGNGQISNNEFTAFASAMLAAIITGLRQGMSSVIVNTVPQSLLDASFPLIDTNKDGYISFDEQWADVKAFDANGDDRVDKVEFVQFLMANMTPSLSEVWPDMFDVIDYDHNGYIEKFDVVKFVQLADGDGNGLISSHEMAIAFQKIDNLLASVNSSADARDYGFIAADTNKDGRIDLDEEWQHVLGLDADGDNRVSRTEFIAMFQYFPNDTIAAGFAIFAKYDNNSDGYFDKSDVAGYFSRMDANGDGSVSKNTYSTFIEVMFASLGVDMRTESEAVDGMLNSMRTAFNMEDKDGDGSLSADEEFTTLLSLDQNGDGKISSPEFLARYATLGADIQAAAPKIFARFDANANGFLERSDVVTAMATLDTDKNGKIDVMEYINSVYQLYASFGVSLSEVVAGRRPTGPLRAGFDQADLNKDGAISIDEQWSGVLKLDTNGDNRVGKDEYMVSYANTTDSMKAAGAKIFAMFDVDNNGFFDRTDIVAGFPKVDANADGLIQFSEYSAFATELYASLGISLDGGLQGQINAALAAAFNSVDTNNDGKWSVAEEWADLLTNDKNGDYRISQAEYLADMADLPASVRNNGAQTFAFLDADSSGYIDEGEVALVFRKIDTDGDMMISRTEFLGYVTKLFASFSNSTNSGQDYGFSAADANGDGILTADEEWATVIALDQNGDGKIDQPEYLAQFVNATNAIKSAGAQIFGSIDADKSNFIERPEFAKGFMTLDTNGDGNVTKDEYVDFVVKTYASLGVDITQPQVETDYGFSSIDANGDGFLTPDEEWRATLRNDKDGDGKVSQAEYVVSLPSTFPGAKIFARFDANGNGFFELDDITKFFTVVDTNADGRVTAMEYKTFVPKMLMSLGVDPAQLG